jgi:hypothetical protein
MHRLKHDACKRRCRLHGALGPRQARSAAACFAPARRSAAAQSPARPSARAHAHHPGWSDRPAGSEIAGLAYSALPEVVAELAILGRELPVLRHASLEQLPGSGLVVGHCCWRHHRRRRDCQHGRGRIRCRRWRWRRRRRVHRCAGGRCPGGTRSATSRGPVHMVARNERRGSDAQRPGHHRPQPERDERGTNCPASRVLSISDRVQPPSSAVNVVS